ncbi:diaminopimelate decarboxylase [Cryobacterium mesophilum]|uniref:Diaminopimelate decarboxylase n=1 Tax=Terrimesophilobacter mesophilus TaxID=433647 RepID=A0A4R8VCQ2_9MICO|nr:diaminopimelate decarboxylase [Terrimesophilobacter mesophilus]MBB5633961.1 diaminopimelate decarboxylase [Terrimesophilobacter mesophilus]TFB80623.1 diaminopimelate decarboxylase [Terrimesophilobacter mesophilus]
MTANPLAPPWLAVPADANALAEGVWPAGAARATGGGLDLAGVSAVELASRFGTPLYVLDESDARSRAAGIRTAFADAFAPHGAAVTVYYAGKAFLSSEVARWMADEGLGLDVASGGELAVALASGFDPARIGFHGNNKSQDELDRAIGAGIGSIVLDSELELERVAAAAARLGVVQAVRVRANSGVNAHTHDYLATSREDQKFGIALVDVPAIVARIRSVESLRFLGLHSHIGSQIFDAAGFVEAIGRLMAVHAMLLESGPVPELNIGGGFGIAYTSADRPMPMGELASALAEAVAREAERFGVHVPGISIEPGRAIIGPAGVTLYTVGTIKDVDVSVADSSAIRRYVSVDGGMSDNVRPALYGAEYSARLANRRSDASPVLARVAGKHCESGDIVVHDEYLPGDVAPGDILAVPATGAYCWSLASNYNYLGRPAVVAVANGSARLIVRRESEADLLSRDVGLSEHSATEGATR